MTSRVEELYVQTRNHLAYRHLVSLESVFSYPVPYQRGERTYLRFLVYRRGKASGNQARAVYRPYARASILFPSGRPVEYVDLYFAEGAPAGPTAEQVGTFPNPAMADLSFDEVVKERSALFAALESVIPFMGRPSLTTEERAAVVRYQELFQALVEPGLEPHYDGLNPRFSEWIEAVTA